MKKKFLLSSLTLLFAASVLCAEDSAVSSPFTPEVKQDGFYDSVSESDRKTDRFSQEYIEANKPGEFSPNLGGTTTMTVKLLKHVITRAIEVETKLVNILINATDGVHGGVTISGSKDELQTGDGITFVSNGTHNSTDAGYYKYDTIVAGYHIKDLYPEASKTSGIDVKNVTVSSDYNLNTVCGIYHEQGGNGAQQEFNYVKISEGLNVSYFGENASVAGFWQRGVDGDGKDKGEPPYISGQVILNNIQIESSINTGTAYGIYQDGTAHIDGNVRISGSVDGANAFGVKGGTYNANLSAGVTVQAYSGYAVGIYLDRMAKSINGSTDAAGAVTDNAQRASLTVKSKGDAVGVLLSGKVTNEFSNYNITVASMSSDSENIALGVYMTGDASVGSMSNLTIDVKTWVGPASGFVYNNTGAGAMSVGESKTVSGLDITVGAISLPANSAAPNEDYVRIAGIVVGDDVDFTVDSSAITINAGNGRKAYGLAYGKDVSGRTDENDGGVGIFNHTQEDSSGVEIVNSKITACAYGANAYGLYLEDANYDYEGNDFVAKSSGAAAYALYVTGNSTVSNLKTLRADNSGETYGVYLAGAATVNASTLTKIDSFTDHEGGKAYGILIAKGASGGLNHFQGEIEVQASTNAVFTGTAYGVYLEEDTTIDLGAPKGIRVSGKNAYGVYLENKADVNLGSTTISVTGEKAYGLYAEELANVSLSGTKITGTTGSVALAGGNMSLASVGAATAQIEGNIDVAGALCFTQGTFSLSSETIKAGSFEIGSADADGNVATAKLELKKDTNFSGEKLTFHVKHATQGAVIIVADNATLTALAASVYVVLDHSNTYEVGDVITLIGGTSDWTATPNVVVSQNGVEWDSAFYEVGAVAGGWGITVIPEPSIFGLLSGLGMFALVASRRRRNHR